MAETKQYITQTQENGSVQISEDVIASIVSIALDDVEGVAGFAAKSGTELADFAEIFGVKNHSKGLKITINEDDSLYVDCYINVLFGHSVVDVAKAVQEAATSAIESVANVKVSGINVNICGIVRE